MKFIIYIKERTGLFLMLMVIGVILSYSGTDTHRHRMYMLMTRAFIIRKIPMEHLMLRHIREREVR